MVVFVEMVFVLGSAGNGRIASVIHHLCRDKCFNSKGSTFKALSELKLGPDELVPYVATAVVKTQASCPPGKVQNNICRFLSSTDIASLDKGRKVQVVEAEEVLRSFRAIVKQENVSATVQTRFFGKLDTTVVRFLMCKPMEHKHENLQAIALFFMEELQKLVGKVFRHGFTKNEPNGDPSTSASGGAVPNFVQFSSDGKAVGAKRLALKNQGFVEGTPVTDGNIGVIRKIDLDGSVTVCRSSSADVSEGIVVSFEDFLAQYGKAKSEIEVLEGWQNAIPMKTASYKEALTKSRIQLGLAMLANKHSTPSLRIQVKPTKSLFAEASFPSGKLCLIPETTRITAFPANNEPLAGGYLCKVTDTTGKTYFLAPLFSTSFVSPMWCIKTTEKEADANMELVYKKVFVSVGIRKSGSESTELELPALVNSTHLNHGDELVVYRSAPVVKSKAPKRNLVLSVEGVSKKSKN